jgi:hypothetical protein
MDLELPFYQSHKKVHALKIASITFNENGSAMITPVEEGYEPFLTGEGWSARHKSETIDLGYYVLYEDGYESWSPTEAFEQGYTLIR